MVRLMAHLRSAAPSALLLLGLIAACGGTVTSSDGAMTAADPVPIAQFPARFADAWCDNVGSCCRAGSWSFDLASCKQSAALTLGTALIAVAVDNPNADYDAKAAGSCLEGLANVVRGCDAQVAEPTLDSTCSAIVIGQLALGATCKSNQECAQPGGQGVSCSGLTVDDGQTSGSGVCAARAADPAHGKAGDQCTDTCDGDTCIVADSTRPDALPCFTSDGLYCHTPDFTCQPQAKLGESCSAHGCVSGAFCASGVCAAQRDTGPCEVGDDTCSPKSFCNEGQCELKRADGSPCSGGDWCQINQCVYPEVSTGQGTCSANSLANDKACSGALG